MKSSRLVGGDSVAGPTRPVFEGFDPLIPHHLQAPWEGLARARKEQPVFYVPALDLWFVTRHSDIRTILKHPETFSSYQANRMQTEAPEEIEIPPGCPYPNLGNATVSLDPPRHTRLRKLMQSGFTPRRVGDRAEEIRAICNGLIDEFIDEGTVDLVSAYSDPIPMRVVALVLGFPPEAASKFRGWADDFLELMSHPNLPKERAVQLWRSLLENHEYVRGHIEQRRTQMRDDLVSDWLSATSDDGSPRMNDDEAVANVVTLQVAGTETTATNLTHTVMLLQEERERWEAVVADPTLIPNAIEETLRFFPPLRAQPRRVTHDTELGGVTIPAGERLLWMITSGNRDEEAFDRPDEFDMYRKSNRDHLTFGSFAHFCIGAPLARLESRIALECLVERIPDLRVRPGQTVEYPSNPMFNRPLRFQVDW